MTLRVVVDSNMLEDELLLAFLSVSPANRAVLTDYAWVEAYKQNAVPSILRRMSVLRQFPKQVIVLKGTKDVAALDARAPGLANRMIWRGAETEFSETVEALRQAEAGDPRVLSQILAHGAAAEKQMETILLGAPEIAAVMPDMQSMFTPDEIRRCRSSGGYTPAMGHKIFAAADQICDALFERHPSKPRRPSRRARQDAFLYRYSLATVLYLLRWIRTGSQVVKRHAKIRNDFIDLNFATYGTYFNGLMTEDAKARDMYLELRHVLGIRGARMPREFVEPLMSQLQELS